MISLVACAQYFLLFPIASAVVATEGYWTQTVYQGITCGNLANNEQYVTTQSGTHFGVCQVGYDAYGVPVSSVMYTLDCSSISNNDYQGTKIVYADLECKSKPISTTSWTPSASCSTSDVLTTSYSCVYGSAKPYKSLSKGYIVGYDLSFLSFIHPPSLIFIFRRASSPGNCKDENPFYYTWNRVKTCETPTSSDLGYSSYKFTCSSSSTSTTDYYYDKTCSTSSFLTETSGFETCVQLYSSSASQSNPSLTNFEYGICQSTSGSPSTSSSSSSDDDEVSLSESQYGGAVSGTLICGILIGAVVTCLSLIFCCGYHAPGGKNTKETRSESTSDGSNNQKSSLSQPIIEESKNEA